MFFLNSLSKNIKDSTQQHYRSVNNNSDEGRREFINDLILTTLHWAKSNYWDNVRECLDILETKVITPTEILATNHLCELCLLRGSVTKLIDFLDTFHYLKKQENICSLEPASNFSISSDINAKIDALVKKALYCAVAGESYEVFRFATLIKEQAADITAMVVVEALFSWLKTDDFISAKIILAEIQTYSN